MKKNIKDTQKLFKKHNLDNIPRIFLSCLLIISFFYVAPIFIKFSDENFRNNDFANSSKKILAYTLNSNEKKRLDKNSNTSEEDLLIDIFSLNDLESDTVRLSASTIKQLFEDTGYDLDDVRKKKLIKIQLMTKKIY